MATVAFDSSSRSRSASPSPRCWPCVHVARTATAVAEPVPTTEDVRRRSDEHALLHEHIVTYRLDGALFFGAAQRFLTELTAVTDVGS